MFELEFGMAAKLFPSYPDNGNLRLYNMFPYRQYGEKPIISIDEMTDYVKDVELMGYNAIWINPLQMLGTKKQPHPGGHGMVSGSLYAMADENAFNPLIFPHCETVADCETKLKRWTAEVRLRGMFPLFDLVLNHVGIHEGEMAPLQNKLAEEGLLLEEKSERWPDIQLIDYYRTDSIGRGITADAKDLDFKKIEKVFNILWIPLIRRYINDYGFMGVRVDALTHIPVPVQKLVYQLIHELVKEKFGTDAFIVGELMIQPSPAQMEALSLCELTHCFNPNSFFWGSPFETNEDFIEKKHSLDEIVLKTTPDFNHFKIQILTVPFNKEKHKQPNTFYFFYQKDELKFVLNGSSMRLKFEEQKILAPSLFFKDTSPIETIVKEYLQAEGAKKGFYLKSLKEHLLDSEEMDKLLFDFNAQLDMGGIVAVLGNHDVGTLKAKVMLDRACTFSLENYNPMSKDMPEYKELLATYKQFKQQIIKGIRSTDDFMDAFVSNFHLNAVQVEQLLLELNHRICEKVFVQALMASGGWYSLAGDEVGICHKPEVFNEFAMDLERIGPSIKEKAARESYDFRLFIRGINHLLKSLPKATFHDQVKLYQFLSKAGLASDFQEDLIAVVRYSQLADRYQLFAYCWNPIEESTLLNKLKEMIGKDHSVFTKGTISAIDKQGEIFYFNNLTEHLLEEPQQEEEGDYAEYLDEGDPVIERVEAADDREIHAQEFTSQSIGNFFFNVKKGPKERELLSVPSPSCDYKF